MSQAIRDAIAPLLIAQRNELVGSRKGARDLERAIAALQAQCFHRLERTDREGYRYRCIDCGKFLKIASGIKLQNDRSTS